MCATCFGHGNYGTANRTAGGKNITDGHKGSSPSKISPTKTNNTQGTKFNDSSHTNNGQVMTQISAIYAKRSRSILNQFGQSNIGQHAHGAHGTSNPVYLNPNSNINQGRGSVGNQSNNHDNSDHSHNNANKGSPRLGRHLRGISPQSREKNYMTSGNNGSASTGNQNNYPSSQQANVSSSAPSGGTHITGNSSQLVAGSNNSNMNNSGIVGSSMTTMAGSNN